VQSEQEIEIPRYKGFNNIEEEARGQLERIIDGCKTSYVFIAPDVQQDIVRQLRPLALKTILHALEGRTALEEKYFGYEWSNALQGIGADPLRASCARHLLNNLPDLDAALKEPAVQQRIALEWLFEQTAGRIQRFTPYLAREEQELVNWHEQCPGAYGDASTHAEKLSRAVQERSRPKGGAPALGETARHLIYTASMIAARKLFLFVTGVNEFFEKRLDSIPLKVAPELQGLYGAKIYIRFGIKPRPTNYQPMEEGKEEVYKSVLAGTNMLKNLQESLCPWTAEPALNQKFNANLMAEVYRSVVRPLELDTQPGQPDEHVLRALGGDRGRYDVLGFLSKTTSSHFVPLQKFIDSNSDLQAFLDKPSVQEAFRLARIDRTLIQTCLSVAVARELVSSAKAWRPAAVSAQDSKLTSQAKSTLPHILHDLTLYHNALLQSSYMAVKHGGFYKEHLLKIYLQEVSAKERSKIESYYNLLAVVLATRDEGYNGGVPAEWRMLSTYVDPGTGRETADYQFALAGGQAIVCLAQGASPEVARAAGESLLSLGKPPTICETGIQGVRISELSYKELRSSCLHPRSIARMQFYTSFSAAETLTILRGITQEPTDENIIEALKPCFILKYMDHASSTGGFYCRVKPAEMVRVKYRTPTAEVQNPCWDASQIIGGLGASEMERRCRDTDVNLIIIEGEKKAAMLAQVMQDLNLPYHVISIPGVWMGVVGPRKSRRLVDEIARFNLRDDRRRSRNCLIFFDNDKAFNPAVMDALIQTAATMQKGGGNVFVPNLPFGKKVKGADDFAMVRCATEAGFNFQPLIDIIENAVFIPPPPPQVKYPDEEGKRKIAKFLDEGEHIHELQEAVKKSKAPLEQPELRELFLILAPHIMQVPNERAAAQLFDSQTGPGRAVLMALALKENPALKQLQAACSGIPSFSQGTTLKENLATTTKNVGELELFSRS
jgi:hypothetical protein